MTNYLNIELDRYFICTKELPYTKDRAKNKRIIHPDAVEQRQNNGYPCGDIVDYECPNCGKEFSIELPQ